MNRALLLLCFIVSLLQAGRTSVDSVARSRIDSLETLLNEIKVVLQATYEGDEWDAIVSDAKAYLVSEKERLRIEDSITSVVHDIAIGESPVYGKECAPLTIVEFSDMGCSYCYETSRELFKLLEAFPGKIRVVFKHYPLKDSGEVYSAHRALVAADALERYFEFKFSLLASGRAFTKEAYLETATEVGLTAEAFENALDTAEDAIIANEKAYGKSLGVTGTPTYFINGREFLRFNFQNVVDAFPALQDDRFDDGKCEEE